MVRIIKSGCPAVVAMIFGVAMGCASGDAERTHEAIPTGQQLAEYDETRGQTGQVGTEEDDEQPAGRHWWGQIQERADDAYDELEDEIGACLEQLDDGERSREIGLEARRESTGEPYELVEVTAYPAEADEHPCVEDVARRYVEAVETAFWDDFDTWVATFLHRGGGVGSPDCHEVPDDVACARFEPDVADGVEPDEAECGDELVEEVNSAMRAASECWRTTEYNERARRHEESPIRLRAVMVADLLVEEGRAGVAMRFNRPWVEPMARCTVDRVENYQFSTGVADENCRSQLNNRAVTLWFGPAFTYVYEGH